MTTIYENLSQQDELLDEATHAAASKFAAYGIELTTEDLYRINDALAELLNDKINETH